MPSSRRRLDGVEVDVTRRRRNTQVQVRKGAAVLEPPSTQEAQMIKKEPYWRLTCRACVARDAEDGSELVIRVRPDLENVMRRKNPFGIETSFKF